MKDNIKKVYTFGRQCAKTLHGQRESSAESFLHIDRLGHLPRGRAHAVRLLNNVKIIRDKENVLENIDSKYNAVVKRIANPYMSPNQVQNYINNKVKNPPLDNGRQCTNGLADMWLGMRVLGPHNRETQISILGKRSRDVSGIQALGEDTRRKSK